MNILITGGLGYVGSILAETFKKEGHTVRLLSRSLPDAMKEWVKPFEFVRGDVLNSDSLVDACKNMDIVIHCAALNEVDCQKDPQLAQRINVEGTKNMLEAAERNRVRHFVYLSTIHAYGKLEGNLSEDTLLQPYNVYGSSHADAELEVLQHSGKLRKCIFRLSNGYGAPVHTSIDRWTLLFPSLCKQAVEKQTIQIASSGNTCRDFVSLTDLAQAVHCWIASSTDECIFNVGGDNLLSIRDSAQLVAEAYETIFGKPVDVTFGSIEDTPTDFSFPITRLKKLGYTPHNLLKEEIIKTLKLLGAK